MTSVRLYATCLLFLSAFVPAFSHAQAIHEDTNDVLRAEVVRVVESETRTVPGTDTRQEYQRLEARLLSGPNEGRVVTVENDFLVLSPGDRFFVIHYVFVDGMEQYSVQDVDRRAPILILVGIMVLVVITFGGWYGLRALLALIGSFFVLVSVLVPGILAGWNPILASFLVATLVLAGALFITHGVNRESGIAFLGTTLAVLVTLLFGYVAVKWASLSGFSADESVYLNVSTRGSLDLVAVLIGGIIIGALGVLDDIAVTQVSLVRELFSASPQASRREVFLRAMRVGREHVGAVINTLALAYMGVSLPLVLLMQLTPVEGTTLLNLEIFAAEIVRIVVGTIGIVLTVPLVTLAAVQFLDRNAPMEEPRHHH